MSYYCSRCLRLRTFIGPFEGDGFDGWGWITLGLVPILKQLARYLVFKPVCIECGCAIVWGAAQTYLDEARMLAQKEEQERGGAQVPRMGKIEARRIDAGLATFREQFRHFESNDPPVSDRRATWSGNGGSLVRIVDRSGALVAKVPTGFTYLGPAFMLARGERLVLFQATIGGSYEKVSIFARTGFCLIPWGLEKWGAIGVLANSDGFGFNSDFCDPLTPDRSIVFGGHNGFGVVDALAIGKSYFHKRAAREYYDRVSRSRTGEHIIVRATQWDDDDVASTVVKVFRTSDGHPCCCLTVSGNDAPLYADDGELLAVQQPGAIFLHALHSGASLATIDQPQPCRSMEFSRTSPALLRVDDAVYALR